MFTEPKSLRVMVADEDEVQRLMIREYLEIVGPYDVLESHGLYHLLAACESALPRIGLVILDMEGSRVDGVDLVLEIRRRNPTLPILGMTDRQADLYEDARLRGQPLVGLIPKPFSPHHLHRSIKAVLRAHGERVFPGSLGQVGLRIGSGERGHQMLGHAGYAQNPL